MQNQAIERGSRIILSEDVFAQSARELARRLLVSGTSEIPGNLGCLLPSSARRMLYFEARPSCFFAKPGRVGVLNSRRSSRRSGVELPQDRLSVSQIYVG
jgi:hypothetical protein